MQIKFKTSLAGPRWSYRAGEVADVEDERAMQFIYDGVAEAHGTKQPTEKAVVEAAEKRATFPEEKKVAKRASRTPRKRSKSKSG